MHASSDAYNLWLNLLRIYGAYPYRKDSKGRLAMKVCSIPFIYTLCMRTAMLYIFIDFYIYAVNRLITEEQEYLDFIISISNLGYFIPHALVMPGAYVQWPNKCAFANAWVEYQNQYTMITGKIYITRFKKRTINACAIGIPVVLPVAYLATSRLMKTNGFHHNVLVIIASLDSWLAVGTWVFIMGEMANIADNIRAEIQELSRINTDQHLLEIKQLWLSYRCIVELFVKSTTVEIIAVILVMLIAITVSVFGFVEILTTGEGDFSPFMINSGICIVVLILIFKEGDALEKKDTEIGISLCNLDIRQMPKNAANEMSMLLTSIESRMAGVQLGRLFVVNLPSLVSVISAIMNNIVVIVQLKSSNA